MESVEKTKKELDEIAAAFPESAPKKIAGGMQGGELVKDLQACPIGNTYSPIRTACCWIFRSNQTPKDHALIHKLVGEIFPFPLFVKEGSLLLARRPSPERYFSSTSSAAVVCGSS